MLLTAFIVSFLMRQQPDTFTARLLSVDGQKWERAALVMQRGADTVRIDYRWKGGVHARFIAGATYKVVKYTDCECYKIFLQK